MTYFLLNILWVMFMVYAPAYADYRHSLIILYFTSWKWFHAAVQKFERIKKFRGQRLLPIRHLKNTSSSSNKSCVWNDGKMGNSFVNFKSDRKNTSFGAIICFAYANHDPLHEFIKMTFSSNSGTDYQSSQCNKKLKITCQVMVRRK